MDKLTLFSTLNRKEAYYMPEKCIVEHTVNLTAAMFDEMKKSLLTDNSEIEKYAKEMYMDDNGAHCVLFLNSEGGDGILVNSEGYSYARYSQYIPNAHELIKMHVLSPILDKIEQAINEHLEIKLEEMKDGYPRSIYPQDLLNHPAMVNALSDYTAVVLKNSPAAEEYDIDVENGFIELEAKPLTETRLYSPLRIVSYDEDYEETEIPSECCRCYEDDINTAIERMTLDEERERGLMEWYGRDNELDGKVESVHMSVEFQNGELVGVATVCSHGPLTENELCDLEEYITGQYSDGWGESFEQHPIKTSDGEEIYVSFWNSSDFVFSLDPDAELSEPRMEM